ncbi:hypothetical protein MuYL_1154 [Mucilaginibacter xinganensis]|uniref:Uncharacterized protein n=1 Tax=Mucilaginibacter xinganensis TaxID=1234841 RepID=A0A223NTP9_9SPHI|nr:hypothetical protein MuYL_1154 [Mucilaginibacter xinganensis]
MTHPGVTAILINSKIFFAGHLYEKRDYKRVFSQLVLNSVK